MPLPVDPGDRRVLIAAGSLFALITVVALVFSPPVEPPSAVFPSTYSAARDGAKAAYLLLTDLGYNVERWEHPPADLPEEVAGTVLILADPVMAASAEEKWQIRRFITKGGKVLATGPGGAALLPESEIKIGGKITLEAQWFAALLPGSITHQAPEIELDSFFRWKARQPHHLTYYGDREGATVVSYHAGAGVVVWWASPGPLTNYGLTQAANLALFLNSVGFPGRGRVLWDEYYHGQRPGFVAYLRRTPTPWMLLQFSVLALAVLMTYGRRSGPVREFATSGSRLSPLEFIETLGDLYHRKGAASSALEIAYHRFRSLLLRRLGLPSTVKLDELQRSVRERLGCREPEFFRMLQQCDRWVKLKHLSEPQALRLVQELHRYGRRWSLA